MENNNTKTALIVGLLAVLAIGGGTAYLLSRDDDSKSESSTSQTTENQTSQEATPTQNIVEVASANESFSTLVAAVKAADLVSTLSDESASFTVFAPTNDAFNKLPAGTLESLLKPENKSTLAGILTYHVVSGAVMSSDLTNGQKIKTVNGAELTVEISASGVYIVDVKGNKSMVTTPDVKANNGVIHIIDTVVLPS